MENISTLERTDIYKDQLKSNIEEKSFSEDRYNINPALKNLYSEGGKDYFHYLHYLNFTEELNLLVLSSIRHYCYTLNDLKGIKILIILEKLNLLQHPDSFLHSISQILPSKAFLVGVFKNNQNGSNAFIYQFAKIYTSVMNSMDNNPLRCISKKSFLKLMDGHGFRIVDTTVINGMTYFCSQNINKIYE